MADLLQHFDVEARPRIEPLSLQQLASLVQNPACLLLLCLLDQAVVGRLQLIHGINQRHDMQDVDMRSKAVMQHCNSMLHGLLRRYGSVYWYENAMHTGLVM